MNNSIENSNNKPQRFRKYASVSIIGVFILLFASHLIWKKSGSNEWKVVKDKDGLVVSTLKTPGESLLKYKANMRVKARLTDVVFYMSDINTGADLGAIDLKRIEHLAAEPVVINYDSYKINLGGPFDMREVVILNQYSQDPSSKIVEMNILAAPNKVPYVKDGPKRVLHLSNHWKFTPFDNGEVEIEMITDADLFLPYVMSNLALADVIYDTTYQMRELLKTEKFKNKQAEFIKELNE